MQPDFFPLIIYKTEKHITNPEQLPVPHSQRICTDLFCTVFSIISILIIFTLSLISLDIDKLRESTYPTDIQGRYCTLDNQNYNYLYFTSITDPTKRLCVSECPKGGEKALKCMPSEQLSCRQNTNKQYQVTIYESEPADQSMGLYCLPKHQFLKQQILLNSKLKEKYLFITAYKSIAYSAICAAVFGLIFLVLTLIIPKFMVYISILLGGISCIAIGIFIMVVHSQLLHIYQAIRLIICIFMILVGLMCLISFIFKSKDLTHCSSFLSMAGQYLSQQLIIITLVLVYYVIMFIVVMFMIGQMLAFWSNGDLKFNQNQVMKQIGGTYSTVMIVICALEFFWIMAFLKESFDFLISGMTVYYSFKKKHVFSFGLGNLFKFHYGSVIVGSFLLNFFYLFDTFYDFIKPSNSQSKLSSIFCVCDRILGFARSDTFSFINILGYPYLNSARYCQLIDDRTTFFQGSQSIFRFFRIGAHILLASLSTLITFVFMTTSSKQISVLALLLSFLINLFVVTFFVSIIAEIAEAMLLCQLVKNYIKNQKQIIPANNKNKEYQKKIYDAAYTIHETEE